MRAWTNGAFISSWKRLPVRVVLPARIGTALAGLCFSLVLIAACGEAQPPRIPQYLPSCLQQPLLSPQNLPQPQPQHHIQPPLQLQLLPVAPPRPRSIRRPPLQRPHRPLLSLPPPHPPLRLAPHQRPRPQFNLGLVLRLLPLHHHRLPSTILSSFSSRSHPRRTTAQLDPRKSR